MSNKAATIPKNRILDFLYSTDRNVSLALLGSFLAEHTEGRYKLIDTKYYKEDARGNNYLINSA